MALAISHEDTQVLLKDKNQLQETVLDKYRIAGQVTQTALKYLTGLINDSYHYKTTQPALTISQLCHLADVFMLTRLEQFYKNKVNERGIALPTTIDVDDIVQGWCPESDDAENLWKWNPSATQDSPYITAISGVLRPGNIVKLSLGVHIDGYTSQVSHSMVIYPVDDSQQPPKPAGPLLGPKASAVAASHIAMESTIALLACAMSPEKLPPSLRASEGVTGGVIRTMIDAIAASYQCAIVPGSRVRRIRRFLAGQNEGIVAERDYKGVVWTESHQEAALLANHEVKDVTLPNRHRLASAQSSIPRDDFIVEAGEVYLIDLRFAPLDDCPKQGLITLEHVDSFSGKSHNRDQLTARSNVYVRDFAQSHILKLKTSRHVLTKIDKHGVYPFKLSHLSPNFAASENAMEELQKVNEDIKSYRLGMSEIMNNYLCVEHPITVAKWISWDHILETSNPNGTLSYDASAQLTLPGHEIPLPKLGVTSLKLKSLMKSKTESRSLPVAREACTVVLCGGDVSNSGQPELLRLTGGNKTTQPSWIHSVHDMNPEDAVVQGIYHLAELVKDKRFGLSIKETQPMKTQKKTIVDSTMSM